MPELTFPPQDPVWPPLGSYASGVISHTVKFTPPRPGRSEKHGPTESFGDIVAQYDGLTFEVLIKFNFGLTKGEHKYFEKINWYLKNKLKCTRTTEKGNFCFSGGETIYIPAPHVVFDDVPLIVARKSFGQIRWIQFARRDESGETSYMVPGVDRTAEPIDSKLPGKSGVLDQKAQGVAALAQFVATGLSHRLSHQSVLHHLERLEPSILDKKPGAGVGNALQPRGPHEAVVVMVRRTKNKHDPSFPKLPFGAPIILGYGDLKQVDEIISRYHNGRPGQRDGNITALPDPKQSELIVEYYVGTRLGSTR